VGETLLPLLENIRTDFPARHLDVAVQGYLHLLVDKLQASVDCHDGFRLVLLQEHRTNLLVDVRLVIEDVKFLDKQGSVPVRASMFC
jgi:hypothetical protein